MTAPSGADVLVGAVSDPDLGPVPAVGLGGRQAGLDRAAAFRLLAETDAEGDELIDSAEGVATQLDGFRGSALLDRHGLRELILRFALLLREAPEVVEADLNSVSMQGDAAATVHALNENALLWPLMAPGRWCVMTAR